MSRLLAQFNLAWLGLFIRSLYREFEDSEKGAAGERLQAEPRLRLRYSRFKQLAGTFRPSALSTGSTCTQPAFRRATARHLNVPTSDSGVRKVQV